ncbi:MAG: photosynthetic complex putative assembly protein PuhB [Pseudomonadota bacterium]
MNAPVQHEHEFEAEHGLPEPLPPGERILWQGAPDWRTLAVQVMRVRTLAIYFALMLLWRVSTVLYDGGGVASAALSLAVLLPLSLVALGLLSLMAWLTSRTTVYTLTDRRVVMRVGIVLSVTFNLPYRKIASAGLRANNDGTGDIALTLAQDEQIAYLHLWPHARPWRVKHTEPMLRGIPDAMRVGELLTTAISAAAAGEGTVVPGSPLRTAANDHHAGLQPGSANAGPVAA